MSSPWLFWSSDNVYSSLTFGMSLNIRHDVSLFPEDNHSPKSSYISSYSFSADAINYLSKWHIRISPWTRTWKVRGPSFFTMVPSTHFPFPPWKFRTRTIWLNRNSREHRLFAWYLTWFSCCFSTRFAKFGFNRVNKFRKGLFRNWISDVVSFHGSLSRPKLVWVVPFLPLERLVQQLHLGGWYGGTNTWRILLASVNCRNSLLAKPGPLLETIVSGNP